MPINFFLVELIARIVIGLLHAFRSAIVDSNAKVEHCVTLTLS